MINRRRLIGMTHHRDGHTSIFIVAPALKYEALRTLGERAADPCDPFDWNDAARCARALRQSTITEEAFSCPDNDKRTKH